MKRLKRRILDEATVIGTDILKVDNFLNHQVDVEFLTEIGAEFYKRFGPEQVTKILTVESSGIAVACMTAPFFKTPVIFAKKVESRNLVDDTYSSEVYSYTRDKTYRIHVSRNYLSAHDKVLIIDDFLANGKAAQGLIDIVNQAGADLVGVGIVIEKGFQEGGNQLRLSGVKLESLAIIADMNENRIIFQNGDTDADYAD
ncbi:MAG: xanthine phosphoribosyltransferase [Syntrophomonadaceae bacterium]|jgi:xanthine phosphoribosyltransferase